MALHKILARLAPQSADDESQIIEAVAATENPVKAVDARGLHDEIIDVPTTTVAERLSVLDTHRNTSLADLLGKVLEVRKEGGKIVVRMHIDRADIWERVKSGVISDVSIGYETIAILGETPATRSRLRTKRISAHVREVSLVPMGADELSKTRKEPSMKKQKKAGADPAQDDVQDDNTAPANVVQEARADVRAIFTRAFKSDLALAYKEADDILDGADDDDTVETLTAAANTRALAVLAERTAHVPRVRVINPGPSPEQTREARIEGLAVRVAGGKPSDQARPFVGFSPMDHLRDMFEAAGVRTRGMNPDQLAALSTRSAQHTLSDFGELLTGTGARLLRPAYEAASSSLVALCRKMTANDFRTQTLLQLGEMPMLGKVLESGEIKSVTRGEAKESWSLETYGSIFSLSRKALINDDLSAFADFASAAGQAAANTVADLIVTALTQAGGDGPIMGDGLTLFHADHGNSDDGGANIDSDSVSAARVAMLTQRGVDGESLINVRPDTLVVPPTLLTAAEAFVAAITPANIGDVNVFAGKLSVACEPRLEAVDPLAWYVAASNIPALVLGGLAGNEGPQIASRDGFDVLGREFRVTLDVGVGPHDWRGWYRNAGATG